VFKFPEWINQELTVQERAWGMQLVSIQTDSAWGHGGRQPQELHRKKRRGRGKSKGGRKEEMGAGGRRGILHIYHYNN